GGNPGNAFTQYICNVAGPTTGVSLRFACSQSGGACCNNTTGACSSTAQASCGAGSTFLGTGTSCNPNPCVQPPGVCCRGATCNTAVAQANCTAPTSRAGARFLSTASVCNAA